MHAIVTALLLLVGDPPSRGADSLPFSDAEFARHVEELKQKAPDGFSIEIQRPFVVLGDEPARAVEQHATRTVKWAVDMLKKDYFKKDPDQILDIWLFKDKASYEKHTKEIFNDQPTTPFGYYSRQHRAIIMNISTGGGTLVHEIVHPFIEANFPDCPAWFNEGLASLYEQCGEKNGHISGLTNWRLEGLQQAIDDGKLPSFEKLTGTTSHEFYSQDRGTNYSQARYLCFYLQEQGLLVKYYHAFARNRRDDPTGYKTLRVVLGADDMEAFQTEWEAFVARLTFP